MSYTSEPFDPEKFLVTMKEIDLKGVQVVDEVRMSKATFSYIQDHVKTAGEPLFSGIRVMFDQTVPLGYGDTYARGRLVDRIKVLSYADELQALLRDVERRLLWDATFGSNIKWEMLKRDAQS